MTGHLRLSLDYMGKTKVSMTKDLEEAGVGTDIPGESFDLVYACLVMHHIEDVQLAINTISSKFLKKGGKLVIVDFMEPSTEKTKPVGMEPTEGWMKETYEDSKHAGFDDAGMAKLFAAAGLALEKCATPAPTKEEAKKEVAAVKDKNYVLDKDVACVIVSASHNVVLLCQP